MDGLTMHRESCAQWIAAGDWARLWDFAQWSHNRATREAIRAVDPTAPAPGATMKAWRDWMQRQHPAELAADDADREAERAVREAKRVAHSEKYRADILRVTAESGPSWNSNGTLYPHALAFWRAKVAAGWQAVATGIGTYRLTGPDRAFIGPLRNKHLNAAIELLRAEVQTPPPAAPAAAPASMEAPL